MESALAEMQQRLQAHEARLQGVVALEIRLLAAETGLAQASAGIADQRRQDDDVPLRAAPTHAAPREPDQAETAGIASAPSFVDTRALGRPPVFSGGTATSGRAGGLPWRQWAFLALLLFRTCAGAYNTTARTALTQAETQLEPIAAQSDLDPAIRDLSAQTPHILALTLRSRALDTVRPAEYGPRLPGIFQSMLQADPTPTARQDAVQSIYEWKRRLDTYGQQSGDA